MKNRISLFIILVSLPALTLSQVLKPSDLVGTWQVDLRPTPDSDAYYQDFIIKELDVDEGKITGIFYFSEIKESAINTDWDKIVISFVTEDNSGFYNTTVVVEDGKMSGTTHSIGREFVSVWTAEKKD